MLKKKLVTIVAAVFCVALVTAQESGVFKTTTGLIEDGAIDSLKFGTEDGSGVIFGQYDNTDTKITLGWGNSLSDTLWLSVFDSWYYVSSDAKETLNATNDATADDQINVDYTATTRSTVDQNKTAIKNDLGVGAGINNKLGFQLVWGADYKIYKNPASITGTAAISSNDGNGGNSPVVTKSEVNNPGTGSNTKEEWTNVVNHDMKNNFVVNFKGIGVEDIGDIAFFAKLNKVYFNWNNITRSGDYTKTESTNGKKTSETTITGKYTYNKINPGINFDLGLNVISNDVATVKFVYEDDFNMTFLPRSNESEKVVKSFGTASETTAKNSYKVEYGKYLEWENKFEPKLVSEFNVLEGLQLKAQLALPVTISQKIDEASTYEKVTQNDTFNREYGYSYMQSKETVKDIVSGNKNFDTFKTEFAPKLSAGFVYQVTPGKFNVSFGASAEPKYTWKTVTTLNANINKVTTTETGTTAGNVTSSKAVVAGAGDNVTETKVSSVETDMSGTVNLGATWFFTENVSFDVYFLNTFAGNLFGLGNAGASVTVKF